MAHLPGPGQVSRFLGQMRRPTRASTVRALVDGIVVILTLKARGARPLFAARGDVAVIQDPERCILVAAAVDAALGLIPVSPTCLRRSVTLLRELQRLGLAATMHIGVRKVAETVEAHAWVQSGDVVVNDDPDVIDRYVELASGELETILPLLR